MLRSPADPAFSAGLLLVLAAVAFTPGGLMPALASAWLGRPEAQLEAARRHPTAWQLAHVGFVAAAVLAATGLTILSVVIARAGALPLGVAAVGVELLASVLWLTNLAFRLGVTSWAAARQARDGHPPQAYEALATWSGALFRMAQATGYLALILYAAGTLAAGLVPDWAGTAVLAVGILGVLAVLARYPPGLGLFALPVVPHYALLLVAVPLLLP